MYPRSSDSIICVMSSPAEPLAIDEKCENSFFELLSNPSAMLEGIDTEDRLIWLFKPYSSFEGNVFIVL